MRRGPWRPAPESTVTVTIELMIISRAMCRWISTIVSVLVLGGLLAAFPASSIAQRTQTLLIRDGEVYINGQIVEAEDLPSSLETQGVEARFSFSGDVAPVFTLNGMMYQLLEGRLIEVGDEAAEDGVAVYFRGGSQDQAAAMRSGASVPGPVVSSSPLAQMQQLQTQRYLSEVQAQNAELYDRLVREWQMENETYRLAESIQRLPRGAQRAAQIDLLRKRLDEIFALKQQNREREIEALEAQIEELQERLEMREQHREEIVEKRLQELIEGPRSRE